MGTLEIRPAASAAQNLGDYTPDATLLPKLNAFEAKGTAQATTDTRVATLQTEVANWGVYLLSLQNRFVPLLTRFLNHAVLGAEARILLPLVQAEIVRCGNILNAAGASLYGYGVKPLYGWQSGVGVRAL